MYTKIKKNRQFINPRSYLIVYVHYEVAKFYLPKHPTDIKVIATTTISGTIINNLKKTTTRN